MKKRCLRITVSLLLAALLAGCNLPAAPQVPDIGQDQAGITQTAAVSTLPVEPEPPLTVTPQDLPALTPSPVVLDSVVVTTERIQEENESPPVIIEIEYPVFTDAGGNALQGLDDEVTELVNRHIDEFREMAAAATPPPDNIFGPNGLWIRYEVLYNSGGLVSIYIPISIYNQGAAHPLPFSESITYDLNQNRRLELSEVFQPGVDYLSLLSERSIEDLNRQGILGWEDGAQPLLENFKSWNLTPEGLMITFDPYQVAPYAAGYVKVVLPWSSLAGVIRPLPGLGE
jgi:hypothetical protein